jgi:TolA-binding protein
MSAPHRIAMLAIVFLAAGLAASAQSPQQNAAARGIFMQGRTLWDRGEFAEAEKKFREALNRYPRAEHADRTAYYLITTLIRQGRAADALQQIEGFPARYPKSPWLTDVQEARIALVGIPLQVSAATTFQPFHSFRPEIEITTRIVSDKITVHLNDIRARMEILLRDFVQPVAFAADTGLRHEVLRVLILQDPDRGISVAQARLRTNPSDPVVVANLSTIANSNSVKGLTFLVHITESPDANAQSQAIYWLTRSHVDKLALATAFGELLADPQQKNAAAVAANALARLAVADQQKVLEQMVQSTDGARHVSRLYQSAKPSLRAQVVAATAPMPVTAAIPLLSAAARDRDQAVRRSAIHALSQRKEPEARKALAELTPTARVR